MSSISEKCPCRGCVKPVRFVGCHTSCERYIDWKAELDRVNSFVKAIRKEEHYTIVREYVTSKKPPYSHSELCTLRSKR